MLDENVSIGKHFGLATSAKKGEEHPSLITNDFVGVEIELERASAINFEGIGDGWTIHSDGSLRNSGAEFVFAGPSNGAATITRLNQLEAGIAAARKKGNYGILSARTSTHVHVDVRDLTKRQLMRMIVLYSVFENVLFETYAEERLANHFCLPFSDCFELVGCLSWLNSSYDTFSNEMNHPNIGRYCAFNLKSIFKFGTVEFRHTQAKVTTPELLEWINACLSFKRGALSTVDFESTFFTASSHGFENQLRLFFPRDVAERVMSHYANKTNGMNKFHHDMVMGIRFAQHLCSPKFRYTD